MSFVNRIVSYVVNELAVNALANSRTFQRFAVRSDALVREAAKTDAAEAAKRGVESAKRAAEDAAREFFGKAGGGGRT